MIVMLIILLIFVLMLMLFPENYFDADVKVDDGRRTSVKMTL